MEAEKYVPNEVFGFYCRLDWELESIDETVYVKPFPKGTPFPERERIVQEKYFTKDKIEELRARLIQKIQEAENPFKIVCSDYDADYNVTENDLFKIS